MTLPLPPQTSEPARPRWRWGGVVLLVLLAAIGASSWHIYTGQRAIRQLREAGFYEESQGDRLGVRLWQAARRDWRQLFTAATWHQPLIVWRSGRGEGGSYVTKGGVRGFRERVDKKVDGLRSLDALAPALRRINPDVLDLGDRDSLESVAGLQGLTALKMLFIEDCPALQNVDGLKKLPQLQVLAVERCRSLQNVDGLKGVPSLRDFDLSECPALQNVDVLGGLAGLKELMLEDCPILRSVDALKGLTALESLKLFSRTALRDVRGLHALAALRRLDLSGCTNLPPEQVAALKAALPNTVITGPR